MRSTDLGTNVGTWQAKVHHTKTIGKLKIFFYPAETNLFVNKFVLFTAAIRFGFYTKAIIRLNSYKTTSRRNLI